MNVIDEGTPLLTHILGDTGGVQGSTGLRQAHERGKRRTDINRRDNQ
jgi:hypothetical protein